MNLQRNLTVAMVALATVTFGFTSCSDDDLVYNNEEIKGEDSTVLISVNVSSELGTSSAKTRTIGMADNGKGKLSYNFDKLYEQQGDTGAFDFILTARYDDKISTNLFENVPIKKKSDGTYYISLSSIQLSIPNAVSTEENVQNLKFCGMLVPNGTGGTFNEFVKGGEWKDMAELSRLASNDKKFFVPLYSNTQITTKEYNWGGSIDKTNFNINLNFSMMGTIIRAKFTGNPLVNDVYIDSVRMRNSNVKSGVIQWKMGDEQDNGYPNFTFGDGEETNNSRISFPQPMLVESDLFNTTHKVYTDTAWVMPVSKEDFTNNYDIYYHIKGDVEYNSTSMVVSYPQDGKTTTHPKGFEYGKVYTLSMSMPESDLMITEFEHFNPGDGRFNYSMIELYNPTVNKIDLTKYGLVRLTEFQHPADSLEAEKDSSQIYLAWLGYDGSGTESGTFNQARLQDIYIDKTTGDWWSGRLLGQNYYYQGPKNCKTVAGADLGSGYQNTFTIFDGKNYDTDDQKNLTNDNNNTKFNYPAAKEYVYDIGTHKDYKVTLEPYELGPGQTVIIGAGAIIFEQQHGNAVDHPNVHYWHSSDNYFKSYYLDNAAKNNRLKFAVAVDNGTTGGHNTAGSGTNSGVMQHVRTTVLQLVKKVGNTYRIIDMPGYIENTPSRYIYYEYIYGGKATTTKDPFVFWRDASALYPMYLVNKQVYTDMVARKDVLDRANDGAVTSGKAYRMYDWWWRYPSNFNISYTNNFTLKDYLNSCYSPGTKTFEKTLYTTTAN